MSRSKAQHHKAKRQKDKRTDRIILYNIVLFFKKEGEKNLSTNVVHDDMQQFRDISEI